MITSAVLAPVAQSPADAQSSPLANCSNLDDPSDSGWTSHEQLGKKLAEIEATSHGRVEVDVIGQSHRGREIYAARVGTGDRVLLVTSEIHGNPTRQGLNGSIAPVDDGSANPTEGCNPLVGFPAGAIALVDRGSCSFV